MCGGAQREGAPTCQVNESSDELLGRGRHATAVALFPRDTKMVVTWGTPVSDLQKKRIVVEFVPHGPKRRRSRDPSSTFPKVGASASTRTFR